LKWKVAILLCLIFFTSIATITISLKTPRLNLQKSFEKTTLDTDPDYSGDPIGGPGGPH
jgi:hypothetical protein